MLRAAALVLAALLLAPSARAEGPKRTKLDNGLRVVTLVDHTAPVVSVEVAYDVGSRSEERGRSGYAELLGRMMLAGSANVARGEHARLVTSRGGRTSAATVSKDATTLSDSVPSGELALALWLEADRMKSLDLSDKAFARERVQPPWLGDRTSLRLEELAYLGYWPYEHPTSGSSRDREGAEAAWVRDFYAKHYGPAEAVVAIVGDFEENECLALVKRYFGDAKGAPPSKLDLPPVPEQTTPRNAVIEEAEGALAWGFVIPRAGEPEHYALEVAAAVLDGSSRGVRADTRNRRGPDLFVIEAPATKDARKLVETKLSDLAKNGPSAADIARARAKLETRALMRLESSAGRAHALAELELGRGDGAGLDTEIDKLRAVTKDDVKRAAGRYLGANRRSLVEAKAFEDKK